jgi:transcriptional regulator with XRE-family HTH domain
MYFRRIRDLREDADIKQGTVAKYLNIAQGTYSEYESGKINIPIDMLIKLADFHHVSLDYLTGRSDRRN